MSWEYLTLIVFVGAFAQSATGVAFGVVAGLFLLQAYGYERAVAETATISFVVAVVSAVKFMRLAEHHATILLSAVLLPGVALGVATACAFPQPAVLALFGLMLGGLGLTMLHRELATARLTSLPRDGGSYGWVIAFAGLFAGAGAYLFAAPGPAAAWGLARARLGSQATRGTLAAYFLLAYAAILVAFALTGSLRNLEWHSLRLMSPVCLIGAVAGTIYGDRLSSRSLRINAPRASLLASGLLRFVGMAFPSPLTGFNRKRSWVNV